VLAREIGPGPARVVYPVCKYVIPCVLVLATAARLVSGLDYPGLRNLPGSEFIGTLLQMEGIAAVILLTLASVLVLCWLGSCPLADRLRTRK